MQTPAFFVDMTAYMSGYGDKILVNLQKFSHRCHKFCLYIHKICLRLQNLWVENSIINYKLQDATYHPKTVSNMESGNGKSGEIYKE
jgi:hypothetical protein